VRRNWRIWVFAFFLAGCWMLFSAFALWAEKGNLLSPEAYFLSFWGKTVWLGKTYSLKTFLLTYPNLPFWLSLFAPGAPFVVASCGVCGVFFASRWVFHQPTLPETLLFIAIFTSPFFLSSLCSSPILTLFVTLLSAAFFAILRHREWGLTHCLFASGFLLGALVLTYPHFRCVMMALVVIVLLFPGGWSRKLGLMLVPFFSIFVLLCMVAFLWWVYEGNSLAFLDLHPRSFAFYLRFPSPLAFHKSPDGLIHLWPFFLPFLWAVLSGKRRLLWGLGAFLSAFLALPAWNLFAVFLVQMSGVLEWQSAKKHLKLVSILLLCVLVALSWGKFLVNREAFFFHLYPQLEEKLAEYRQIEELAPGRVLVLEPAYFLVSSWREMDKVWTPEHLSYDASFYSDFSSYDCLITSENSLGFPGFELVWRGKELELYQKADTLTVRE